MDLPNSSSFHPALFAISRNWEEGDYDPDWRNRQVVEYLQAIKKTHQHSAYILGRMSSETDEHVLRLLNFQLGTKLAGDEACGWTVATHVRNSSNGLASFIKALILAGCSPSAIAGLVHTETPNIECFESLYWDVARYRHIKLFIANLVFPWIDRDIRDEESIREGLLFTAAYFDGLDGISRLLTPHIGLTAEERQRVVRHVKNVNGREGMIKHVATTIGYIPPASDGSRYIEKMQHLLELPTPLTTTKREADFAEAAAAVGQGAPLSEFL